MTTWIDKCHAIGGTATRFPSGPNMGQQACRTRNADGTFTYRPANMTIGESLAKLGERIGEAKDKALGAAVETRDAVKTATGLDRGALGVLGKIIGVPPIVVLAAALGAGYLLLRNR